LEIHSKKITSVNYIEKFISVVFTTLIFSALLMPSAFAHHLEGLNGGAPAIYSINPQYIPQGQVTTATVTGINLNSTFIGVTGGDVFGVVLTQDIHGDSLTVQFAAQPTALGEKKFFVKNENGQEASFPIQVIPSGAPKIDIVDPNSGNPRSTILIRIIGTGLNKAVVTSPTDGFFINSYRSSTDGTTLYLSVTLAENLTPGTYQIYINTLGGQVQTNFLITDTPESTDPFNSDPSSPGIYSIEADPTNKNLLILKGAMFETDPLKNTVTLLETKDGTVTGRQVEIISANASEIIVNLPNGIASDSISFAVSSSQGKSSNIKSIDLGSLDATTNTNTVTNQQNTSTQTTPSPGHIDISTVTTTTNHPQQPSGTTSVAENPTDNNNHKDDGLGSHEKAPEKPTGEMAENILEDINIAKNIKTLSQYILSNSDTKALNETITPSIDQIKDPAKLISTIEETKQIKNQADLIMLALNEVKENQELSNTLKKAESLKTKVEELEKVLAIEQQKDKPDQRKLAKYRELLSSANAESRSQTFVLLNNLLKYKPQLKQLLSQKPFDLAAIQPNIPNDSVILQYVPSEEGLIIFVVDNKNLKTRINKNISRDILNREVQAYRNLFENEIENIKKTGRVTPIISWKNDKSPAYKKYIQPLKEKNVFLYNALIGPIERDIANKKVVAIIANGWLRYLPFQSLAKPTKDGDLRFLISDKSIVYLDSVIAISKNTPQLLSAMSSITVIANPDGTLTGANKEAEIIAKLYSKTTMTLVQQPFNIPLINQLASKADILHLATHGYLDATDINSSYLVSGKKQKGETFIQEKLLLKDIYDLNLPNSKLVVLSGCDTAKIGNLSNEPDDIVGSLSTAFRVAGANTILASLWKAHDEATKIIMQSFYENLKAGSDKAEALRKAELKLKENPKYGHPLFWSLFSLIGDWR